MNNKYTLLKIFLGIMIVFLGFLIFRDIMRPFRFKKEAQARMANVTTRMNDLKSAEELFMMKQGRFTRSFDSLYLVIITDSTFLSRPEIKPDSLKFIPYSDGTKFEIKANDTVNIVNESGAFEIRAPYSAFLKGLDKQMVGFMIKEKKDSNLYPGLIIGLSKVKANEK